MASQPTIHDTRGDQTIGNERPLTRDEAWDLIFSLRGSAKEMFAEVGGGEAWIRFLRDETPEKSDD
ncbi:MAG TPA: hypothetical protein VFC39_09150 [Acidobacteriaceae bacterium]|nr:hypothetical protein [Acidobacteriaceae bacterium]